MKTDIKFYVSESLFKLLKTKNLNEIKITDIVNLSNISRTTFYNNFRNINDVIFYKFNIIIEDLYKIYNLNSLRKNNKKDLIKNILVYINKNKEVFLIIKNKLFFEFKNSLDNYFVKFIKNIYNYYIYSGSIINICFYYLENDININTLINNIDIS